MLIKKSNNNSQIGFKLFNSKKLLKFSEISHGFLTKMEVYQKQFTKV